MKNWNNVKYAYQLTGAELIPIVLENKEKTITLKELIDKILSYSTPKEGWGIPPTSPLEKLVYKNKEDIGKLKSQVTKVDEKAEFAYDMATKSFELTTETEDLVREALRSAKKAEMELLDLKRLELAVDENSRKILESEVHITEEYSSSGLFVIYKFYQGKVLLTTIRIPTSLVYRGSDYIGIDTFNTIYLNKDKFEEDYILPLQDSDIRLSTSIVNEINRATEVETSLQNAVLDIQNNYVTIELLEGDTYNISSLFNDVRYNSDDKVIEFYHNDEKVAELDATPFVKDAVVDNVSVETVDGVLCLVITFNTDSGKETINIPVSAIFDASLYYTKTEVDKKVDDVMDIIIQNEEIGAAADNDLNDRIIELSGIVEDNSDVLGQAIEDLQQALEDDEEVIAAAFNDLNDRVEAVETADFGGQITTLAGRVTILEGATSSYETKTTIVNVAANSSAINAEENKLYVVTVPNSSFTITLPTYSDTNVHIVTFLITTGTTPSVSFTSTATIDYMQGFLIEASMVYEVSAMFDGSHWKISYAKY